MWGWVSMPASEFFVLLMVGSIIGRLSVWFVDRLVKAGV